MEDDDESLIGCLLDGGWVMELSRREGEESVSRSLAGCFRLRLDFRIPSDMGRT